jgi:microcystin-dependent protein
MQITIGEGTGWRQTFVPAGTPASVFNVDYPFFSIDDLIVQLTSNNVSTTLVRGSDYDVGGTPGDDGVYPSGVVTLRYTVAACIVTISRDTAEERTANFPLTGFLDRLALNQQLNRITVILQDLERMGESAIRVSSPDFWVAPFLVLPPIATAAGKTLMFDAQGHPYYGTQVDLGGVTISSFGQSLMNAATADAANSLLGMSTFFKTLLAAADAAAFRTLIGITTPTVGPIGTVYEWAGAAEPANFMFCDGRLVSRTTYSALFAAIGTAHGAGDGSTTFAIPDRRGRAGFGKDDMGTLGAAGRLTAAHGGVDGLTLGAHGGLEARTLSLSQMPSHNHAVPGTIPGGGDLQGGSGSYRSINLSNDGVSGAAGGTTELPMTPPAYVSNYIIRVT